MIPIEPSVHLLRMWAAQPPNYAMLFCEAVDNAFDAAARRIAIQQRNERITFEDDGIGITYKRLPAVFTLGEHAAMTTTRLGTFGIGITTQAIAAGNRLEVETISAEGCYVAGVDWREILKRGKWLIEDPTPRLTIAGRTGTLIVISALRKAKPISAEKLIHELANRFHPALSDGRQIILNGKPIAIIPDPPLIGAIEHEFDFDDDRRAHLRAGILATPSKRNRIHVSYAHRVIMPGETFGCGDYGGLTKMFARLHLTGRSWKLTPYKDEFGDQEQRDELEVQVAEVLKPILEQCQSASFNAKVAGILDRVLARLPPELAPARAQKKKKEPSPSPPKPKKPKRPGQVDEDKSLDKPGPARTPRPKSGPLIIEFDGKDEEDGIAGFSKGPPPRINLPLDNPTIARIIRLPDEVAAEWTLSIVMQTYIHHKRQQADLLNSYGRQVADLLLLNQTVEMPDVAS
jgi:hypothetical protein